MNFHPKAIYDSLYNVVSALGTSADKATANQYILNFLTRAQLEAAYRGDWVARKVVDIPPFDMTREWRAWQADKKVITLIEGEERRHQVQLKVQKVKARARLYGGAALLMGFGDEDPSREMPIDAVQQGGLKYVTVVSPYEMRAAPQDRNVLSEFFGAPKHYEITPVGGRPILVHPSRVIRFIGSELPDANVQITGGELVGWGDSVLQAIDDAIKNAAAVTGGVATMVHEASFDVIGIPNLMESLATEDGESALLNRIALSSKAKSMVNAVVTDAEEKWTRISTNFSALPDVLKMYLLIASGAADIPATRLLGQSAQGLNSTGESDIRNYYDRISAEQKTVMSAELMRFDEVLIRSATGKRDESIHYWWRPLWQMDAVQKATVEKSKADVFKIDAELDIIDIDALRKGRENQLIEDGTYPGFEQMLAEVDKPANEDDPQVIEQFAAMKGTTPEVQKQALNGAQITSLQEIVTAVGAGDMPLETAKALIKAGFPALSDDEVDAIINPMANFETKPQPASNNVIPFSQVMGDGKVLTREQVRDLVSRVADAQPKPLYVRRDVLNGSELLDWAKSQGITDTLPASELHVTLVYSRQPVDWMKMGEYPMGGDDKGKLTIPPGGPRMMDIFGPPPGETLVLLFSSTMLQWRHQDMCNMGCSHDYEEYQPHISIAQNIGGVDVKAIEPYRGKIVLGPEIFEEIKP